MISIGMLKLICKSIWKPLNFIFQSCIKHGEFPTEEKKAIVDKKVTNRFYQIIDQSIFERLICNSLYDYFIENELSFSSQCGFKPGDSCVDLLLSILTTYIDLLATILKLEAFP